MKPGDHVAHGYVELSSTTRRVGVGWLEFDDNERHLAVRWSLSNFDSYWYDIPQAVVVNSSPFFAIWEAFATDEFVFYVNSDEKWRLPRDHPPFTMFTPDRAQIYGHIDTLASQMPGTGTPGAKESFSNAELRIGTGSLEDFNGAEYNPSSAYFGMEKISGRTYQTWDKYC